MAARCKAQALGLQPAHGGRQIVHPQPDVVERRGVHRGFLLGIQRLHEVDLHRRPALTQGQDVLVDVLTFALKGAGRRDAEQIDPQGPEALLVKAADGDLLEAEDLEGALRHGMGRDRSKPESVRAADRVCDRRLCVGCRHPRLRQCKDLLMNIIQRAQDILLKPKATWPQIAAEPASVSRRFSSNGC
jgi:hypothetical protein